MKLNSKLTGGLAWAGLILVLAVPSADILTKGSGGTAATMTSDMDAIETATATPAVSPVAAPEPKVILARPGAAPVVVQAEGEDPVDEYLSAGKKLPSYISDAPAEVAASEPAPVTELVVPAATTDNDPVEVAAVDPAPVIQPQVAPVPYPASMRPTAPVVTATAPAVTSTIPVMTATAPAVADEEAPLIIDEDLVERREAAVAAVLGDEQVGPPAPAIVTSDELEEWDSGSLADYLERRGLMSSRSDEGDSGDFDDDGFFLDEGPNDSEARLRRRLRREGFFF